MSQRQLRSSSQEMRAFNQQISTNGIANRNNSSSTSNIPRSFLTCVLELSQADNQWKSRFCEDERSSADTDDLNAVGRNTHCVTRGLSIVLNILRLLCFYPRCSAERKKRFRNRWICLFVIRVHTHQRLLDSMDTTELCFRSAFSRSPPLRYYSFVFAFIILFAFMIPFTLRVFEFYCTEETLVEPLSAFEFRSEAIRERLNRKVRFTLAWASLQTRQILSAVLTIIPNEDADLDRFQISCFVHKMSTQYMWGMTVWRAFPLERTTFFTLVSVIITYSFLLLKLKDNPAVSPIRRNLLTNSTY
ncbi:hypothetical protein Tcan_16975 [Toxocara canis]|uniref:Uncharacterized protein n=1 Tax=Toxocara canis TaxID=6265 RepID=A0A0B2VGV2_TOXCA|nr:hypothetical protein Tcan_16975 [Toxocara canis]